MPIDHFDQAVTVVTGAASGIGQATARELYARGAHLVLADLNEPGLRATAEQMRAAAPQATGTIVAVTTDVTQEGQVQELMRQATAINGRLDLVVNCAGIGGGGSIDEYPTQAVRRMMDINFFGTFHCVHAALPTMRQQGAGHFVLISSVAGKLGTPLATAYCASKWAVRGFCTALRIELYGSNIGVTTVYPAWVDTPMVRDAEATGELVNVQVLLTAEQVAGAMLQAALENATDLTMAPNRDIAHLLELMKTDPELAERKAGAAFQRGQQRSSTSG